MICDKSVSQFNGVLRMAESYWQWDCHEVEVRDYIEHRNEGHIQLGGSRVAMIYM